MERVTKQISIETETGAVVETVTAFAGPDVIRIRRLGWRKLEEAERAAIKLALAHVRDIGGIGVVREIQEAGGREAVERQAARDPLSAFDKGSLLTFGIVTLDGEPTTADAIDAFEPETALAVARAIVKLSRPGLFETEAEQKNG